MPSVAIVTASVGRSSLRRCVDSVRNQDASDVRHLVVVDGPQHAPAVEGILRDGSGASVPDVLLLPRNTGHSGHYGYRIYGALPLLLDEDIVCFLDEDNWLEPDHVSSALSALHRTGASWAYSLRRIVSSSGQLLCEDDSDSLGYWPKFASLLDESELSQAERTCHTRYANLVDSSCYVLPRSIACAVAPLWQNLHADSVVPSFLIRHHDGTCTGRSTVNYALGGGTGTPVEWFEYGNRWIRGMYGASVLPWREEPRRLGPGLLRHPARPRTLDGSSEA